MYFIFFGISNTLPREGTPSFFKYGVTAKVKKGIFVSIFHINY